MVEPGRPIDHAKVVNEGANWSGYVRLVDDAGLPVAGICAALPPDGS